MSLISSASGKSVRPVSLHLSIWHSLYDTAMHAHFLERLSFQCFLISQLTGKHITVSPEDRRLFIKFRERYFQELFVHGSYWINIAAPGDGGGLSFLKREVALAQSLSFTHYVLHVGAAQTVELKDEAIRCVAARLNMILSLYPQITLVLEHGAHGGKAIGSDLKEFVLIKERLNYPERVVFCLDTAHAYAWGYDIAQQSGRDLFLQEVDQTMGLEHVALLHLNDALEPLGSKRDRHAVPGQGLIGADALRSFMLTEAMRQVPVIVEVPSLSVDQQKEILAILDEWNNSIP